MQRIPPARILAPWAILCLAAIMLALPASATGSDDDSGSGIPVFRYDFGQQALVPVMDAIMLSTSGASVHSYDDGKYFVLQKGKDANGRSYIVYMSYGPGSHFVEEPDLQKTREALKEYCQANNLKADGAGTGAVTEKFRQCSEQLPGDRLTALLYPVEFTA